MPVFILNHYGILRVMDQSDDSVRFYAAMENMIMQQTTLIDQNAALAAQNATLITQTADLTSRIAALEEVVSTKATDIGALGEVKWICPVCNEGFKHRESFKGHIRRLANPVSPGARCFLDSEKHSALLAHERYGGGDFDSRKAQFVQQLYDTVRSASSSRHTSESSHRQVRAAIAALLRWIDRLLQFHRVTIIADLQLAGLRRWCCI